MDLNEMGRSWAEQEATNYVLLRAGISIFAIVWVGFLLWMMYKASQLPQ